MSPFPTVFFKSLVLQTHKNTGLFGKGLNLYCTILKMVTIMKICYCTVNQVLVADKRYYYYQYQECPNQRVKFNDQVANSVQPNLDLNCPQAHLCCFNHVSKLKSEEKQPVAWTACSA